MEKNEKTKEKIRLEKKKKNDSKKSPLSVWKTNLQDFKIYILVSQLNMDDNYFLQFYITEKNCSWPFNGGSLPASARLSFRRWRNYLFRKKSLPSIIHVWKKLIPDDRSHPFSMLGYAPTPNRTVGMDKKLVNNWF
jgi:hypothetical protein